MGEAVNGVAPAGDFDLKTSELVDLLRTLATELEKPQRATRRHLVNMGCSFD